jgi:allantoinase
MDGLEGLSRVGQWCSAAPARLAGMSNQKGAIQVGGDADFAVFDPDAQWTVGEHHLNFRHKISPYLGVNLRGLVIETWLRGQRVFSTKGFESTPRGKEWVRQ